MHEGLNGVVLSKRASHASERKDKERQTKPEAALKNSASNGVECVSHVWKEPLKLESQTSPAPLEEEVEKYHTLRVQL